MEVPWKKYIQILKIKRETTKSSPLSLKNFFSIPMDLVNLEVNITN